MINVYRYVYPDTDILIRNDGHPKTERYSNASSLVVQPQVFAEFIKQVKDGVFDLDAKSM